MTQKTYEIAIIGLGKFGLRLASSLLKLGHTVVGIDIDDARVQRAETLIPAVYKADATVLAALRALHIQNMDWVVVCVGKKVEQSLSITLNLQDLSESGHPRILVKASNEEHRKILTRLGVDRALLPDLEAADILAHQLSTPGILDLIPQYEGFAIRELKVDRWNGKDLIALNLIRAFKVIILGIRRAHEKDFLFIPPADTVLRTGDMVVVAGSLESIKRLEP